MADDREPVPLIDLAVMVVSPALVMLMVGSLVWFLVDVIYQGPYAGRLLWSLSFFVFGAVLVARIAIEDGYRRASLFGLLLGGACFLAMLRFVDFPEGWTEYAGPVINLGLMALVWWSANRLTRDCTHLDEDRRASGRGILAAAGLGGAAPDPAADRPDEGHDRDETKAARKRKKDPPWVFGWLARYGRYKDARARRPHTPGTWVLYFGLAALPVFALGQSLVAANDSARRLTTLMEMAAFVGSGLGLLVVTSLLGLRKYLQQKDARVPAVMTAGWLGLGGVLIVVFLAVGALLPRPHSEVPWFTLDRGGKGDRQASKNAVLRDNAAGKGEGAKGTKQEGDKSATKPGDEGPKAGGKEPGDKAGNDAKTGNEPGKAGEKSAQPGGKEPGADGPGGQKPQPQGQPGDKPGDAGPKGGGKPEPPSNAMKQLGRAAETAATGLKWLVWVVIALAVVAAVAFFVLRGLAPFTDWAKNLLGWLRGLFRRRAVTAAAAGAGDKVAETPKPSFADFNDPFADGSARKREPAELVAYTFAAVDGWAWDRGRGREVAETPAEFADRLREEFPELGDVAGRLAGLSVRALYSRTPLPADTRGTLKEVWARLNAAPAAVAAG